MEKNKPLDLAGEYWARKKAEMEHRNDRLAELIMNNAQTIHVGGSSQSSYTPINPEQDIRYEEGVKMEISEKNKQWVGSLIKSVLKSEAGYQRQKEDKGNYYKGKLLGTNKGITPDEYAKYLKRDVTLKDMKNITEQEAAAIYEKKYYKRYGIDKLPKNLQEIALHGVVNSGGHAVKVMQELLGFKGRNVDGVAGPITKKAMREAKFTKLDFAEKLLNKYKTFNGWKKYGKGWTNRFMDLATHKA